MIDHLRRRIICERCKRPVDCCVIERDYPRHFLTISVSCHGAHDSMSIPADDDDAINRIERGDFIEARAFVQRAALDAPALALVAPEQSPHG